MRDKQLSMADIPDSNTALKMDDLTYDELTGGSTSLFNRLEKVVHETVIEARSSRIKGINDPTVGSSRVVDEKEFDRIQAVPCKDAMGFDGGISQIVKPPEDELCVQEKAY